MIQLVIICALCFTAGLAFSQESAHVTNVQNVNTREMSILEVVKVHLFSDSDRGAFFTLSDGSKWYRTWWAGSVYNVDVGQVVGVIPMSNEEAVKYQHGWHHNLNPFWIVLNPQDNQSPVGIAFKLEPH